MAWLRSAGRQARAPALSIGTRTMGTTTIAVATAFGVLLGFWVGYTMAGVGGGLVWAVLWGVGGWLTGLAIVSTTTFVSHFWKLALAAALFVGAVVLTWGVRF